MVLLTQTTLLFYQMNRTNYTPSNHINPAGHLLAVILSVTIGILCGYGYGVFTNFSPSIYLNFFACLICSGILGYTTILIIRVAHIRNRKSFIALSLLSATVGFISQWLVFLHILTNESFPSLPDMLMDIRILFIPGLYTGLLPELFRLGSWSVVGIPVRDWGLMVVWLIEMGIFYAVPLLMLIRYTPLPYAETQKNWYPKFILHQDFASVSSSIGIAQALNNNLIETIDLLGKGSGNRYSKIEVFYSPLDSQQYLTIKRCHIDHKGKKQTEHIITALAITNTEASTLLRTYPNKKEKVSIF
jgi:hypothetical protein